MFAIDHPAFNHGWLWQLLSAQEYAKPLNPGDDVDDKVMEDLPFEPPAPSEPDEKGTEGPSEEKSELNIEDIIADLPPASGITPIADWQKHFRELEFTKRIASALQKITNIKSQRLGAETTAHELPNDAINLPEINQSAVEAVTVMSREALVTELRSELVNEPRYALMASYKMETADQTLKLMQALEWILEDLFQIKGLAGLDTAELSQLHKLRFSMPGLLDEFRRPEVVMGILGEAVES